MNSSNTTRDSLWEQIKQVLREFFHGSRKKVSSLAETIDRQAGMRKLAAQIGLLRRERQQLLLTMGKKAYSLHTRGKVRNRDILQDCLRIDEIEDEATQLRVRIDEIRRQAGTNEDMVMDLEDEQPVAKEADVQADETEENSAQADEE